MVSAVNSGSFDYSQIGVNTTMQDAANEVKDQVLGQEDFLKLLTTQLQAQDPTNPADNSELVSQMSQLSMVDSLNSINSNMAGVIDTVNSSSTMTATNLIGTYVYTDDDYAMYSGTSGVSWSIDAGEEVYTNVKLTIKDATTGEVVYTDTADALSGEVKFGWPGIYSPDGPVTGEGGLEDGSGTDTGDTGEVGENGDGSTDGDPVTAAAEGEDTEGTEDTDGTGNGNGEGDGDGETEYTYCPAGKYVLEVTGTNSSGQSVALKTQSLALVTSVTLGKTKEDTILNLYGHGTMKFSEATKVTI